MRARFNLPGFNVYHLRQLYKRGRISYRKIKYTKVIPAEKLVDHKAKVREFAKKLEKMTQLGFEPVYLDEVMFTQSTNQERTWAAKYAPILIDRRQSNQSATACLVAVSASRGVELVVQYERSVNKHRFDDFLGKLKQKRGDQKSLLVLDNLSVHTCGFSQTRMAHHGFKWLFTVPNLPDGNAIEFVFSMAKRSYKKMKLQQIAGGNQHSVERLIEESFD